ncbi:MAG: ECF-type sigma factor [Phycisphaerales bacterium]|nr:ECF-type sigma factor [Phycisphaerales bacterium]
MVIECEMQYETLGSFIPIDARRWISGYDLWKRGPQMDEPQRDITELLNRADEQSGDDLLEQVYNQLRRIAQNRMSKERPDHTLEATALVHEAYAKLLGNEELSWQSRAHFFNAAAQAMRRILIDHARSKNAIKRGGEEKRVPLGLIDLAQNHDPSDIVALEEAMITLENEDPRAAQIVSLRFYAGLTVERTALALDLSERTVIREWTFARARLFELLSEGKSS